MYANRNELILVYVRMCIHLYKIYTHRYTHSMYLLIYLAIFKCIQYVIYRYIKVQEPRESLETNFGISLAYNSL